ncbi:MAG: phosphopantetheine-binding protein, partial [Pseudolabrys sp.]
VDFQIKLRGFRIEPGEIEAALRRQATVKDCVVIMREDVPGDQRLSAYVIPTSDGIEIPGLMRILKTNLPDYMVPADIILIDAFPLTSSGKIDRKALPAPVRDRWQATEFIAPRTPYEIRVAAIWAQTLSVPRPGVHDNFFELGGHSLLAIRVMARINREFGIQLPLRELFENPTIEGLAQAIVKNKTQSVADTALMDILAQLENISDADAERMLKGKSE